MGRNSQARFQQMLQNEAYMVLPANLRTKFRQFALPWSECAAIVVLGFSKV